MTDEQKREVIERFLDWAEDERYIWLGKAFSLRTIKLSITETKELLAEFLAHDKEKP